MAHIQIDDDLWRFLNEQKDVGESFDSVLKRLLKFDKKVKGGEMK